MKCWWMAAVAVSAVLGCGPAWSAPGRIIPDQYIVVLKDRTAQERAARVTVLSRAQSVLARVGGGVIGHVYEDALSGFSVRMSANQANALRKTRGVAFVEPDREMTAIGTETGATWGLDRIDQRALPLNSTYIYPDQGGAGVHVYVIDTGITANHVEFTNRVGPGQNFAPNNAGLCTLLGVGCKTNPADTTDCNGHGTHVSGTAVGTTYGVAKLATVHSVRVLGCNGSGSTSGVIAGVNWLTSHHESPAVANMSLGGGASDALDLAVTNAVNSGITFAVAAGNDNADACASSPARAPLAITVGATTKTDARASYSNFGTCVDVFAPGDGITSAWKGSSTATNTISGTSMATPHVTGVAALILGTTIPTPSPALVATAITTRATAGAVTNAGTGSPNKLLYMGQ
jgi:subtilisin family serine protease